MAGKWRSLVIFPVFFLISFPAQAQDYNFRELVETEANYILKCQFNQQDNLASGAINNIYGEPSWVVPRENAMAILGLIMASDILEDDSYRQKAQLAADYLLIVQDNDGAWFNQYHFLASGSDDPKDLEALSKSPTQTAEVMIALYKLGYQSGRYPAMKKAAGFLMQCQKKGGDGNLLGGGKDSTGTFRSWRWASDNSYAYQALKAAEVWALMRQDYRFALSCAASSRKILKGIDNVLYIKNPYDPDYGVWLRAVDEKNQPIEPRHYDWINYAPQMLNLPTRGVGHPRVGKWIHNKLQKADGACVWDNGPFSSRKSPGYSFQAVLCWRKLSQPEFYIPALNWALADSLWQVDPDLRGISGGWIDWVDYKDDGTKEQTYWWERFIDTSFYSIAAYNGGYDFSVVPGFFRIGYTDPRASANYIPCYLKLKLESPQETE